MERVERLLTETAGASAHPLVAEACLHLAKAGGKRLRPTLVLLASRAGEAGGRATDMSAAAIELLHLASLYHDDVLDGTETRRGVPTAHNQWSTQVAVLAGDYLFAAGCALGADAGGEVPGILSRAIVSVCEGEIVETAALNQPRRPVADYMETIRLKTAALFSAACELGAVTSGASPETRAALVAYGSALGLAFQIVDDVLDFVSSPSDSGKGSGTDLQEGVFTLPVLLACARQPGLAEQLTGDRSLEAVVPALKETGALADAAAMAESCGNDAVAAIAQAGDAAWRRGMEAVVAGVLGQLDGCRLR
jgi:geranylgeranyl pyrophosphate synthase